MSISAGHFAQLAVHLLAQDFLHGWEVDRHRDDRKAHLLQRRRDVEGRLAALGLRLDAEHRHPARAPKQLGDATLVVLDQVPAPLVHAVMVIPAVRRCECPLPSAQREGRPCPARAGCRKPRFACCRTTWIPGRGEARRAGRLRRKRQGGSRLALLRAHLRVAAPAGGRRDAARAEREAGRRAPHPPGRAAGPDRQLEPVPKWATWEKFRELERAGLTCTAR